MKRLKIIFLLIVFCIPVSVLAQKEKAYDYLNRRGEVYFALPIPQKTEFQKILNLLSVDNITADSIIANANLEEFEKFLEMNVPFRVLPAPGETIHHKYSASGNWDYYPTYTQYVSMMEVFETDYPQLCSLFSIGKSVQNRDLWFLKITSGVIPTGEKPKFMYSSSMHGDETVGFILMLRLIDYLLSNYGTDDRITQLLDEIEIYINPLFNPDGAYFGGDGNTILSPIRRNANSKDLNRNYPDPRIGANPDGPYQPETLAMMAFLDTMVVTMSANFHGGAEVVNFPWDSWLSSVKKHPDYTWFRSISKEYADTVKFFGPAGYFTNPSPQGFIPGGDWYIISGGQQDYITYFAGGREITVELSNVKFPSASTLPDYWQYNYRSLLNFMEQVRFGIKGKVTDSSTGLPLVARIELVSHDADSSWVYSDRRTGFYFRPAAQGVYTVRVSSYGYKTKTINTIQVLNRESIVLNVELESDNDLPEIETVSIIPNPVVNTGELRIFIPERTSVAVDIYDLTGKKISAFIPREYPPGEVILPLDATNLSQGLNILRIRIGDNYQTRKVIFIRQ